MALYLALAELCDEHLLTEYAPGRYSLHELLGAYAAERARTTESDAERRAAVHGVLDYYLHAYYLHAAAAASSFIRPRHIQLTLSRPRPGVVIEEISGPGQAAEWFGDERFALLAAIGHAVEGGYSPHAWELPWAAGWLFQDEACWRRLATAQESALAFAVRLGDLDGQVIARQHLGWLGALLGDLADVGHHLDQVAELARPLGNRRLQALVGLARACILQSQGCIHDAMVQATQAQRLYHAAGDRRGEMRALNAVAGVSSS